MRAIAVLTRVFLGGATLYLATPATADLLRELGLRKFERRETARPNREPDTSPSPEAAPGAEAFAEGSRLFEEGRYEEARTWLEQAVKEAPGNAKFRKLLEDCRAQIQRQEQQARQKAEQDRIRREVGNARARGTDAALEDQRRSISPSGVFSELDDARKKGTEAAAQPRDEIASRKADCGFGVRCIDPMAVKEAQSGGANLPAVVALRSRIPQRYKDNESVKISIQWFTKLEVSKVDTLVHLAEIERQINEGSGPLGIRTLRDQLEADLRVIAKDQAIAVATIDKVIQGEVR